MSLSPILLSPEVRSPRTRGLNLRGGGDYALIIVRARASKMLSGLCEHDKTIMNTETMILTFVPVVGVAYFLYFFGRERYDFMII